MVPTGEGVLTSVPRIRADGSSVAAPG